ncbi:hypothetical protein KY345_00010 [Candidatus Woesearchaeota archaeon]|nr:hypothetical protein [Candidatus Woesearchaeota archaeon]
MVDSSLVEFKGEASIIERARPEIDRIRAMIMAVDKAFDDPNLSRLGRIRRELKNILHSIKRTERMKPEDITKEIQGIEREIEGLDPKEASRIRKTTADIERNEREMMFLNYAKYTLEKENKIDREVYELIRKLEEYERFIESKFKDVKAAASMKEAREGLMIRVKKKYIENMNENIYGWSEASSLEECSKILRQILISLARVHKDEELSKRLLKMKAVKRLLHFREQVNYLEKIIAEVEREIKTGESRYWIDFYKKKADQIAKELEEKYGDHRTAGILRKDKEKNRSNLNLWLKTLKEIYDILKDPSAKEVTIKGEKLTIKYEIIQNAKQKIRSKFGELLKPTGLPKQSAEKIEDARKKIDERIKTVEGKKVPKEFEKLVKDIDGDFTKQRNDFREKAKIILDMIRQSEDLDVMPKTESELEKLKRESDELNHGISEEKRSFAYILNIFAFVKRERDISMQYVAALQKTFSGLAGNSGRIKTIADSHNDSVDYFESVDDKKVELYKGILIEMGKAAPDLEKIVKRVGIEINIGELKALPKIE